MKIITYLINKVKTLKLPAVAWCILFSANSVFVQQGPEELIRNYKISFPIVELGNCANYTECRLFCEDPLNQNTCAAYAKDKGFYKAPEKDEQKEIIVDSARGELGCTTHRLCKTFCEQKENIEKCSSFAQRHKLYGGYQKDIEQGVVLEKARAALGCSSLENCKTYCEQDLNKETCTNFARNVGIRGGVETKGPGNCTSDVSCKAYCSSPNNFEECTKFASSYKISEFKGPGGCNSHESCKEYCDKNPQECYGHSLLPYTPSDSINACTKIAGCVWVEDTCRCSGGYEDPKTACNQTPGCSWIDTGCRCSDGQTSQPGQTCQPPSLGCGTDKYWDSYSCSCKSSSSDSFSCQKPIAGCGSSYYWDFNSCSCKPYPTTTTCQPPSSGCGLDKYWSYESCSCKLYSTDSSSCHEPSGGCGTNYYWDSYYCTCRSSSSGSSSSSPTPIPSSSTITCQPPSSGCGTNYYWDSYYCTCRSSSYGTPTYGTPSYGTPSYSYPSPSYGTPTYGTPTYGTPSYGTPSYSYPSPDYSYPSPSYGTPSYGTPSYGTPSYGTPSSASAEEMCRNTSGCTWTGTTCQCSQGVTTAGTVLSEEIAEKHGISFPIYELGNCTDCQSCNTFCANPKNREKCIAFSKNTGLYDEEQKEQALIYEKSRTELGCDSDNSCKIYCQKEENFDKCKIFAAKHDIIDAPVILNLTPGAIVSETQSIELKAPKSATLDIMLQPIDSVGDTIYVGRTRFKGNLTTGDFSWDSTNTPNGEYNLIATVTDSDGKETTVGPIKVTVNNTFPPGVPEVTTKDIALASQFKPDEVAVDNNTAIDKIENQKTETNQSAVELQGKGNANTIVTLLIYSNPIIVTVKTDANGLWKYSLEKPLNSGEHIAYVVTSRTDGTKVRSEASTFFIPPAIAASGNDNLNIESANESSTLWIFVYATIAIIIVAIALLLIIYKIKSRSSESNV